MTPQAMIAAVGNRIGCPGWASSPVGACALAFEDGVRMELRAVDRTPGVCFIATLGVVMTSCRNEALSALLLANRFLGEWGEPWLAYDPNAGTAHFCRLLTLAGGDPEAVVQEIAQLLEAAREYRRQMLHNGHLVP